MEKNDYVDDNPKYSLNQNKIVERRKDYLNYNLHGIVQKTNVYSKLELVCLKVL